MRHGVPAIVAALSATLAFTSGVRAATLTLTKVQLLSAEETTIEFGGNGQVLSRMEDGDGILYEILGGTIDFGKVALRARLNGADLTGYDAFGLRIEIVAAPSPVEVNPFVQTGANGTNFRQDVPGVKVEGDAFDSFVPLAGTPHLDEGYAAGFQYFTAGDVLEPEAQIVRIRISPIPEPATLLLVAAGLGALGLAQRQRGARAAASRAARTFSWVWLKRISLRRF